MEPSIERFFSPLLGSLIVGIFMYKDDMEGEERIALLVSSEKGYQTVFVESDMEGNDAGWLKIQPGIVTGNDINGLFMPGLKEQIEARM